MKKNKFLILLFVFFGTLPIWAVMQTNEVDYFEDNSVVTDFTPYDASSPLLNNAFGGYWDIADDHSDSFSYAQHTTTIFLGITGDSAVGAKALVTSYTLGASDNDSPAPDGEWAYWSLSGTLDSGDNVEKDLTGKIIDFWIKGKDSFPIQVTLQPSDTKATPNYGDNLYFHQITVTTAWQHFTLTIDSNTFDQDAGWGITVPPLTAFTEVVALAWAAVPPDSANPTPADRKVHTLFLDQVSIIGEGPAIPVLWSPVDKYSSAFLSLPTDIAFSWSKVGNYTNFKFDISASQIFSSSLTGYPLTLNTTNVSVSLDEGTYYWRVACKTNGGAWEPWSQTNSLTIVKNIYEKDKLIISDNLLNFKDNPNAKTIIQYKPAHSIDYVSPALTTVRVFDITGKVLLKKNLSLSVDGFVNYKWDGKDAYGNDVNSGVYIVQVQIGKMKKNSKVIILR